MRVTYTWPLQYLQSGCVRSWPWLAFRIELKVRTWLLIMVIAHHISDICNSKCARPWHCPLEWTNFKCKYANRKPRNDFIYDGDNNVCYIFHHLHIANQIKCKKFDLENEDQGQVFLVRRQTRRVSHDTDVVLDCCNLPAKWKSHDFFSTWHIIQK